METKSYPLSISQTGIYYEWEKDKSLTQYNMAFLYDFPETTDTARLQKAFKKVFEAHPNLKVKIRLEGEDPVQYFDESEPVKMSLTTVNESEMEKIISGFVRPFDLLDSALYRIALYRTEKKLYTLIDIHHIIFDGSSVGIFNRDLARAYDGEELTKESITGCDFAEMERSRKWDAEYIEAEAYFEKRLSGITMTKVPTINNKETEVGYIQRASEFVDLVQVNDFCTKLKISPNNLFAGALGICLNRYSREQEIAFCTVHHGRLDERLLNDTGMFVKTLPVTMKISPVQKVSDYLAAVRADLTGLWSKQAYPFYEMVKKFGASVEVMYTFQKGFLEYFEMDGRQVNNLYLQTGKTFFSLNVYVYQSHDNYEIRCEYNDSLYDQDYMKIFASAIKNAALNMIADEKKTCGEISILSEEHEADIIRISSGKPLEHDRSLTLVDLFREQAKKTPNSIAVVFENRKLTYRELDQITDQLAKKLYSSGVQKENAVGVMIDRSEYMVIYPLAIMKSGGAYMPLDFTMPSDRLSFMVKDAGARFILSEGSRVADSIPGFAGKVINKEEIPTLKIDNGIILPRLSPENMFVLLYTSGSTGTPKGCMLEHRNIVNFCRWYVKDFDVTPQDRSVAYANFAFDAHMIDIYPLIITGASVYILPSSMRLDLMRMNQYMEENGLTIAFMTTQIGRQFAEDIENHSLRLLSIGGERLVPTKKPPYRFYNVYGPTECTLYSTFYNIESDYKGSEIGHSLRNVQNYVMDTNLQLLPIGVAGELCIGGEGVGRGYLNRDELNKEKFVKWKGQRIYRTGDLVRYNEAGEIEYIGRLDNQVKLRGLRIELGEIESAMSGYAGVSSAVVDVKEIGGVQHLCGYFTAKTKIDTEELKKYLRTSLTEFMVPTALIQMEKFPLTNNGKVNHKLLPVPQAETNEIVAPQTQTEQHLFDIISDILKTKDFGIDTNLFSIGMTSILAIRLSIAINKKLGIVVQTKDILRLKTIRQIAGNTEKSKTLAVKSVAAYEKRDYYPLTENQKGLYYDWEKNRDAMSYNIPAVLRFSDKVDVKKLKDTVIAVVETHPYLKTTLAIRGNEIVQLRRDDLPVEIIVNKNIEMKMDSILSSFVRPFNLFGDTLYRFAIYQTERYTYLLFDIHHIIFDGGSMGILLNDLKVSFEGKSLDLEKFTAFDRALEEKEIAGSEKYSEAESYFNKLLGGSSMTVFPSSSKIQSAGTAKEVKIFIPAGGIVEFCKQNAVTESNFFLAVYCLVLNRYTRENRIALTTASSGRADNKLSDLMGMFVKTLPVVVDIKSQSVFELVKDIQNQMFATMERDIFPFTKMAEQFGVVPQINYVYEGGIDRDLYLGDEHAQVNFLNLNTVKFPISAVIFPGEGGYTLTLEFDDTLYQELDVRKFTDTYAVTASIMSASPEKNVSEISLVTDEMKAEILKMSEGKKYPYDRSLTFIDVFRRNAEKHPGKIAVVDEASRITYKELDKCSDSMANKLINLGVAPNTFVAVMLPRRKEYVVSVLAVHKAGGAFIPLDSDYPNDRLLYMFENSESKVLITERALFKAKQKEGNFSVTNVLFVDEFDFKDAAASLPIVNPENLAYMIYTSGSTGKPKGVMICHKSLVAFLAWYSHELEMTETDNVTCHPSFSFDASVIDLFTSLYTGAAVHIISSSMRQNMHELFNYIVDNRITGGSFNAQFGMEMLNQFEMPLRFMMLGGEKLSPVRRRKTQIVNAYGPTEFTICSQIHRVNQDIDIDNIPIGPPAPNTWSYVLDANRQLLPAGIAGELCLSGIQVGKGYWKRDDLTAEKFISNPYATCDDNAKLYRTGDLVKWNDKGELEFIGRIDTQIKLRGFRIELGEIESVMNKFEGVTSAVVDVKEFGGSQQLCGYYTAENEIDAEKLLRYLKSSLTEYMVPTALIKLQSIPLTPNGKVNRKALPLPDAARTVEYVAPTNKVEQGICDVYSEVLKIEKIGILDNFFDIGGSSMSAIKAIIRIINIGYQINYGDMFKLKTPKAIAKFLLKAKEEGKKEEKQLEDISDYDYMAINKVLASGKCDLWEDDGSYRIGDVLLTGATGYLGTHVLRELIEKETGKIYCMVRSKGSLMPERRLKSYLMYYFSDTFNDLFGTRIIPVNGDITNISTLASLKGKGIKTIFNCAASVKHYAAGDELDKINVDGVANLIDFCRSEGTRLIHISTASTGGVIEKDKLGSSTVFNEFKLYFGQAIDNKYVLSKFKSERLVLQAVSEGMDGKIMRVGNLMGRQSDGEFQMNFRSNAFINIIKSYKVLKMFPLSQLVAPLEISPIDYVAMSVVSLSKVSNKISVLHAYNNYRLNMANMIYAMKEYGFEITLVSDKVFNESFQKALQDPRKSEYMSGLLHYKIGENFVEVPDENDFTTTLLYKNGIRWPLATDDYSIKLIQMLDGMGFFDEN